MSQPFAEPSSARHDGRVAEELRPVTIETGAQRYAEGSALISMGNTRVLCAASVEQDVPRWLRGQGSGWVTAEYAMLPRATAERSARESQKGRIGGRTHEIQRLIGRALRGVVDLRAMPDIAITLDCDVLQADGGTRTASITGAWVALALALDGLVDGGRLPRRPGLDPLAAVSVGVVGGTPVLDLDYVEDSTAGVDMNVVVAGDGRFIEVQGTAEGAPFSRAEMDGLLDLAVSGCRQLFVVQEAVLTTARGR